jgi:hypothetical protein
MRSQDLIDRIYVQKWVFRVVVVFCPYSGVDCTIVGEEGVA